MPCVGFELTIQTSELAKTVPALDGSATVTGMRNIYFFSFGATAPIKALAYLHETLRFTLVY
jgi:hypothetical protein